MDRDDAPSKTRRKREMHELQALGEALAAQSPARWAELGLPEPLVDALVEMRAIRAFEARRRQLQFIGRLMREVDPAPLRAALDAWQAPSREATALHRDAERWRERLVAGLETEVTEFVAGHPGIDVQRLRTLVRSVQSDRAAGRPPRHYRELFRLVHEALRAAGGP
jgi:ribosome-associated protein